MSVATPARRRHRDRDRAAGRRGGAGHRGSRSWHRCCWRSAIGLLLVAGIGWVDDHRPLSPWLRLGRASGRVGGAVRRWPCWTCCAVSVAGDWPPSWPTLGAAPTSGTSWTASTGWQRSQAADRRSGPGLAWPEAVWGLAGAGPGGRLRRAFCRSISPVPGSSWATWAAGRSAMPLAPCASWRRPVWARASPCWPCCRSRLFMVDAGLTLLRRLLRGERWWTPHTQHAYQAWARATGHGRVTLAYAVISLLVILARLGSGCQRCVLHRGYHSRVVYVLRFFLAGTAEAACGCRGASLLNIGTTKDRQGAWNELMA